MTFATTITIRHETRADIGAREALLDAAMGEARFAKASERLRETDAPAAGLSFVATEDGHVVGTVRLWPVTAGAGRPALLLGPLAVASGARNRGIGSALMECAIAAARASGAGSILLVGDAPYYARFGFSAGKTADLWMPGPFDLEPAPGAGASPRRARWRKGPDRSPPPSSPRRKAAQARPAPAGGITSSGLALAGQPS